jgi:2-polyprenyl-6-methoxyphenol hydroxylase-like FAD-dependent oxidoreductase
MFSQFTHEPLRRMFAALPAPQSIITTEIEELWVENWHNEKAVLLGDAAHAMTPNIGQGAGMAMEDARVLAEELAGGAFIERALANYVRRRKPRVETVVRISREVGTDGQRSNPVACWLRNRRVERHGRDLERSLAELEQLLAYAG